jgi:hypothetical protein
MLFMAVNSMSVQYRAGQGRKMSCCAVLERHLKLPHFAPLLPPHISSSLHLPHFYRASLSLYLPLPSLYLPLPLPFFVYSSLHLPTSLIICLPFTWFLLPPSSFPSLSSFFLPPLPSSSYPAQGSTVKRCRGTKGTGTAYSSRS